MSHNVVLNISFCAEHYKGGDGIPGPLGQLHWEWLEEAVLLYESLCAWPIFISITGFRGFETIEQRDGNCERDVLWRIFARPRLRLVTMAANPGHQVGAAWCIRLGLEAAAKLGYAYMVHTAEDVVPDRGVLERLISELKRTGADFISEEWGEQQEDCSAQFFACRTASLVGPFDPCAVPSHMHIERYLRDVLNEGGRTILKTGGKGLQWGRLYRTCHDLGEWRRWAQEVIA